MRRRQALVAGLLVLVALSGCTGGTGDEQCTMVGGKQLGAAPVSDENVSAANVTPYSALSDTEQKHVRVMVEEDGWAKYRGDASDFPDYVRYNGTVYEITSHGNWDDFCNGVKERT